MVHLLGATSPKVVGFALKVVAMIIHGSVELQQLPLLKIKLT